MGRTDRRRGILRSSVEIISAARRRVVALRRNRAGNVAVLFSLMAPVLMALAGATIDYVQGVGARSSLQTLADGAALAGAQSLRLANVTPQTVSEVIFNYVAGQSGGAPIAITSSLATSTSTVAV
jgi:Flp pilus assembly protein TadG